MHCPLPPAVIIHGLRDATTALGPGLPVTLLSAPSAGAYAGCGWWRAVIEISGHMGPDILDCGWSAGDAVEALAAGCRWVVLSARIPAWPDVAGRAGPLGAVVLSEPPPSLDLGQPGAARNLAAWLAARDTGQQFR